MRDRPAAMHELCQLTPLLENVVTIRSWGRSGSVFLQSLLDGHPNVIMTPGIFLMLFYDFFEKHGHLHKQLLIENFLQTFAVIFDSADAFNGSLHYGDVCGFATLGAGQNEHIHVDREAFKSCITDLLIDYTGAIPRKLFFQAVHVAYAYAARCPETIDARTLIVFPLHFTRLILSTDQFVEDFPKAKHLWTVRHPINCFGALVNAMLTFGQMQTLDELLCTEFFGGPSRGENAKVVRLEDLHKYSRQTLEKLCDWLEIPWNDCLNNSTFNGQLWWGDRASPKVNGFSAETIGNRHKVPWLDRFRLSVLLVPKFIAWDYDVHHWYRKALVKLLALPLLLVPFDFELAYMRVQRQNKLRCARARLKAQAPLTGLKLVYWLLWAGALTTYWQTRRTLLIAWMNTFARPAGTVEYLRPIK